MGIEDHFKTRIAGVEVRVPNVMSTGNGSITQEEAIETQARSKAEKVGLPKRKIMYVDRDYRQLASIVPGIGGPSLKIRMLLSQVFDVDAHYNLDERIIDLFRENMSSDRIYEALITHVPYESGKVTTGMDRRQAFAVKYDRSLRILRAIKEVNPKLFILAYTGAMSSPNSDMDFVFKEKGPIDYIVLKSSKEHTESDFNEIKEALEQNLK